MKDVRKKMRDNIKKWKEVGLLVSVLINEEDLTSKSLRSQATGLKTEN